MTKNIQRAIDKQAEWDEDNEHWPRVYLQRKLARAVIEAAACVLEMRCECGSQARSECCWMPSDAQPLLLDALAAWADHVNGDDV